MAGQHVDTKARRFQAAEELFMHRLVKLSGDHTVVFADAGDEPIGTCCASVDNGKELSVALLKGPGTLVMVASGVISQNALCYTAADGKITATVTGKAVGTALEAAGADGDWIEVLPLASERFTDLTSTFGVHHDFIDFTSGGDGGLVVTATDSGTNTVDDAAGGILSLAPSDGTVADNDEIYVHTGSEVFRFANNKPLWFKTRLALTEANTDDANVIAGLVEAAGANALLDNGGGPPTDYDGAVFYKIDGGTVWQAEVSVGTTQTAVTLSTNTWPGDGTYQELMIEFIPTSATASTVNFYIDGTLAGSATSWNYSGANEMDAIVGAKNGSANNEDLLVDYLICKQVR